MEIRVDYENNFIRLLFKYLFTLSATIVVIFKQHIIKLHNIKSDMIRRRSSRRKAIHVDLSDMHYDSTSVTSSEETSFIRILERVNRYS